MKPGLSGRDQRTILLIGVSGIIILSAYFMLIVGPLRRGGSDLGRKVRSAREQLRALEAATANEATVQEQYRQVEQTVASLRRLLPGEEELPAMIGRLSDLASQTQVKIQTIFPQRSFEPEGTAGRLSAAGSASEPASIYYRDIPIQIDALAGYHQLGAFLSLIESGDKPLRVSSLRISANPKEPKRHHVKLLLVAYFATNDALSAGGGSNPSQGLGAL